MHTKPIKYAGCKLVVFDKKTGLDDETVTVIDWADRYYQRHWHEMTDHPLCREYAYRRRAAGLPEDDEVILCRWGQQYLLVHASELDIDLEDAA